MVDNKAFLALITSGDILDPFLSYMCTACVLWVRACACDGACVRAGDKRSRDNPRAAAGERRRKLQLGTDTHRAHEDLGIIRACM